MQQPDIVTRLRDPYIVLTSMVVRREAADEIERLLAYVEEWKRRYETARLAHEEGRAEIERLRTEIKMLNHELDLLVSKEMRGQ